MGIDRRVGVVGLYHAGKTVFLTSLINHLQEHDPDLCPIGEGDVRLEGFRELPADGPFAAFDYKRYRQFLVEKHAWPEKTRAVAEYRCALKALRRGSFKDVRLSLLDIPGERLADMFMCDRTYAQWSDEILRFLEVRPEYREHAGEYLALMRDRERDSAPILPLFKELLGRLILDYKPIVTPSTFIVAVDGGYPGREDRSVERLVARRSCGLDADSEFAPLTADARGRWPQTAQAFAQRFEQYKRTVLQPIADWLKKCDLLAILVDVTTILASGLGMYEGNRELLEHLVRALDPGRSGWGVFAKWFVKLLTFGQCSLPAVERIAFVATKVDKVLQEDRQRVQGLLKNMTRRLTSGIEGLKTLWGVCSAVDSTEDRGDGKLEGHLLRARRRWGRDAPELFAPSRVPDDWPENWDAGDFSFPDVRPQIPARRDAVPRQIGLHQIINFILEK